MARGDEVLDPFDFTDRSGVTWRPAVIVSSHRYNQETPDVPIASITGNLHAIPHPGDHRLQDWQAAGLLKPSLLQTKLATMEVSLVGCTFGRLSAANLTDFDRGLRAAPGV